MTFDFSAAVRELVEDEGGTETLTTEQISKRLIKQIPKDSAEALLYDLVHASVSRELGRFRNDALRRFRAADPATLSTTAKRDPRMEQIRADFWSSRVWVKGTYKTLATLTAADCDDVADQRERSADAIKKSAQTFRNLAKLIEQNKVVQLSDLDEATVQAVLKS